MSVGNICRKNVITIDPFENLAEAARLMRQHHVGYLIVVEPQVSDGSFSPVGVLTDRDIVVSVVAREADARMLRVDDAMTRKPIVANESDPIPEALASMRRIGVRRLPVVGNRGELRGVISLDDILEQTAQDLSQVADSIRKEQRVESALRL